MGCRRKRGRLPEATPLAYDYSMEENLFNDLVQSLKEAKAIAKGEMKPSRRFVMEAPDAKTVREGAGLTHVSIKTLQNWEQHRRIPTGPAAALLKIVSIAPDIARQSLHA
jgi:putative transcriptional regulator